MEQQLDEDNAASTAIVESGGLQESGEFTIHSVRVILMNNCNILFTRAISFGSAMLGI